MNIDNVDVERYHKRMTEIQNICDSIAVGNLQLNKMLQKFGWSRSELQKQKKSLVQCPFDKNHVVKEQKLSEHTKVCSVKQFGINNIQKQDFNTEPSYGYENSTSAIPVFVSWKQYQDLGCNKLDQSVQTSVVTSLREIEAGINEYISCDPLDELRFIYSWKKVPTKYFTLHHHEVPIVTLKQWITDTFKDLEVVTSSPSYLINSICGWSNEQLSADEMVLRLKSVLGEKVNVFVLKLWKFILGKSLCLQKEIPEHTRNEFDFYGAAITSNVSPSSLFSSTHQPPEHVYLPMEWVDYHLTREQKLNVYEHVIKVGKCLSKGILSFNDLETEAQDQMRVLSALNAGENGAKTQLQILAEMRDYKRRRQSYRGKNKANRKMTGLEVLREVVDQQMLYFKITQEKTSSVPMTTRCVETTVQTSERDKNLETSKQKEQPQFGCDRSRNDGERHRSRSNDRRSSRRRSRSKSRDRRDTSDRRYRRSSDKRRRSRSMERRRSYGDGKQRGDISNVTYY